MNPWLRALLAVLALLQMATVDAQTRANNRSGRLSGQVSDPAGQRLHYALVTIQRVQDSTTPSNLLVAPHSTTTDTAGRFSFDSLIPGRYAIRSAMIGLDPWQDTVRVHAARSTTVSIRMTETRAVATVIAWPLGDTISVLGYDVVVVADRLTPAGTATRAVFDSSAPFQEYLVRARVQVQICEDMFGEPGCRVPGDAGFRIGINPDSTGALCRRFLKSIERYWQENPDSDSDPYAYAALPLNKYVFFKNGSFVLYDEPEDFNVGNSYFLYTPGILLRVELTEDPPVGVGALETFVEQNLKLWVGFDELRWTRPDIAPRKLMQMIHAGFVTCPS